MSQYTSDSRDIEDYAPEELYRIARSFWIFVLAGIILPLISYLALVIIARVLVGGSWFILVLLLITTLLVSALVRIWYSNFGAVKVEERNGYLTFLTYGTAYLLLSVIVLG